MSTPSGKWRLSPRTAGCRSTTFERGANALLPDDISVRAAAEVPPEFDPRRHALSRWYRYTLHLGRRRTGPPARLRVAAASASARRRRDGGSGAVPRRQARLRRLHAARRGPAQSDRAQRASRVVLPSRAGCCASTSRRTRSCRRWCAGSSARWSRSVRESGLARSSRALVRDAPPGGAKLVAPARGLCLMKVRYENGLFDDETDEDI